MNIDRMMADAGVQSLDAAGLARFRGMLEQYHDAGGAAFVQWTEWTTLSDETRTLAVEIHQRGQAKRDARLAAMILGGNAAITAALAPFDGGKAATSLRLAGRVRRMMEQDREAGAIPA